MSPPRVVVVAIAGPSSAGKTTLSAVLAESFASSAPIIHQDAYFRDKCHCPLVSFVSTSTEEEFVQHSVANNRFQQYLIDEVSRLGGGHDIFGPDSDCDAAVNFGKMYQALDQAKTRAADVNSTICNQSILSAEDAMSIAENSNLIQRMKDKVSAFKASLPDGGLSKIELIIVDGFLLYSDPASQPLPVSHHLTAEDHIESQAKIDGLMTKLALSALHIRATSSAINEENEASFARYQKSLWKLGQIFKYALESKYQIKLFLPTTFELAKSRRFQRTVYQNAPPDKESSSNASDDGVPMGDRHPGQMWKTEGYFNGVVWKNFEENYGWLLKAWNEGRDWQDGIYIRPGDGCMNIDVTTEWAVDIILSEYKVMIEQAHGGSLGSE